MTELPDLEPVRSRELSLQELEPSPVDETPYENEKDYFPLPETPTPRIARTSTLGLSGHGPVYWLTALQKYSSYTFLAFATMHITNTSLIPLVTRSVPQSSPYLLLTRPYYQDIPMEPLLITLPLAIHITSGLVLRLHRRRKLVKRYAGAESLRHERRSVPWPTVSGTSKLGYAAMVTVASHAVVNRIVPLMVEGGSTGVGLEYVSHGFAKWPLVSTGFYAALVGASVWHGVWGMARWLGLTPAGVVEGGVAGQMRKKRRWYVVNGVAAAIATLWAAGGIGIVGTGGEAKGWVGKGYDELFRSIPVVGPWL
ncbi:hypothetical protein K490DRAFT_52223 [Saccharata proteae CBS 121410]|uniref:Mitochondrial adapter protein MCP1 transmembrane domain-containing protein n=1 Tax=Saccharata proteae CBS 121410 TaxID=1314787 RepID=A0A9P4HKG4_9PEZI|nr:hypothetical protein K490DRAFT_52223 [Saccharata proteae CBS 121410]